VRAKIVKAMMGINQQKKTMIKQRLTSSVSIFFTSPYLTTKIVPSAAIPTTTIDQPTMSHLKNSDNKDSYDLLMSREPWSIDNDPSEILNPGLQISFDI
jgi:hypothetical protein